MFLNTLTHNLCLLRGRNQRLLGNLIIVSIYSFGEHYYREKIALEIGFQKPNDLKVPVLGDVGHLRNSILHYNGRAYKKIKKCEVLRWFQPGDEIILDEVQVDTIVVEIRKAIKSLAPAEGGMTNESPVRRGLRK